MANNVIPFTSVSPLDSSSGVSPYPVDVAPSSPSASGGYGPLIGDILAPYALIMMGTRFIGTIIPDVVVEESHRDETRITDHPVEMGAAITDHAFMEPFEVEMRVGFSNSTVGAEGYVQLVYQMFQGLQQQREPFSVSTGKRLYNNMLVKGLSVITDTTSEYALNAVVTLRQIIITNVTFSQTNGQQNTGSQNPTPAPTAGGGTPPPSPAAPNPPGSPPGRSVTTFTAPATATTMTTPWEWVAAQPITFELPPGEYVQGIPQDYLATDEVWV